jgi:hypothetical protein
VRIKKAAKGGITEERMPKLSDRIDNALNENRILLLGGEVLLGFSYRPYVETSFDELSLQAQVVHTIGLGVMTLGFAAYISSSSRIASN